MNVYKYTARTIGILFIIATLVFGVGNSIIESFLKAPNAFEVAYPNTNLIITGLLIELTGILAIPLIPIFFFPILKKLNQELALSYIVLRTMEAMFLILSSVVLLPIIYLSEQFITQSDLQVHNVQIISSFAQSTSDWIFFVSVSIIFPVNALLLNYLLFKSKLIPRYLSVWGIIGASVIMLGAILISFGIKLPEAIVVLPIAIQEMVFALWLIIKGFNKIKRDTT